MNTGNGCSRDVEVFRSIEINVSPPPADSFDAPKRVYSNGETVVPISLI